MPAKRKKATAKRRKTGGVFNFGPRVTKTRARRGGRIFHKYPKVSKTESRRLPSKTSHGCFGPTRGALGEVPFVQPAGESSWRKHDQGGGWASQWRILLRLWGDPIRL